MSMWTLTRFQETNVNPDQVDNHATDQIGDQVWHRAIDVVVDQIYERIWNEIFLPIWYSIDE